MSKPIDLSEISSRIDKALNNLGSFFKLLLGSPDEKSHKKAGLIAYWIQDYVNMLKRESNFSPRKLIRFSRGNIVRVNFGFRIGNELGGSHYAIVLDTRNAKSSGLVTVIPLTSVKPTSKETNYSYLLKFGVKDIVEQRSAELFNETSRAAQELTMATDRISKAKIVTSEEIESLRDVLKLTQQKYNVLKKTQDEVSKMRDGSIANVGQVVTISKQRISYPLKSTDVLFSCSIDDEDLHEISEIVTKLFINTGM